MTNIPIPLSENIIVIEDQLKTQTDSGLFLPETRVEKGVRSATVVAVGPGRIYPDGSRGPMDVKVNDRVLFGHLVGVEIKFDEGSYLVISQRDVIAILPEG